MIVDKIKHILSQDKRQKLVFYFDADGSFQEELKDIEAAGIDVITVNQNYFDLKYKLEMEWNTKALFLYHPFSKPNDQEIKKYPLLDLLMANHELQLDDASEFMSAYHLAEYQLPLVKRYIKQLKTKTNQKKLARILDPAQFNETNLKRGLISISLDFSSVVDKNSCMAKLFTIATDDKAFAKILKVLNDLDLDQEILNWFNFLLATNYQDLTKETITELACKLKYNLLIVYVDKPFKVDSYSKFKLQRSADINRVQSFFQDWENQPTLKEQIALVFETLATDIQTNNIITWYGSEQEFGYYSENMLSSMIGELYKTALENPVKTKDECVKWLRNDQLSTDQYEQIKFIYHTTGMYAVLAGYKTFKFNKPEDFVSEYTAELHLVDYNYRKALTAFDQVRDRLYEFEDLATDLFNQLNQKYDRFLIEVNVEWQQALNEQKFNFHKLNVNKQFDFYNKNLKDFDYKIVVIVSDALRYELGYELYNDLLADSKNQLTIEPCLASIPSYTNLGMSNLLPNAGITVQKSESDLEFKIGDKSTVSANREAILKAQNSESTTIDFSKVMKFDHSTGREFFKNNKIVYVYHDWIDAVGDKKRTEDQTFEASSKAVEDIKRLIKKLYGWNVYHILVTSDHGFLFNYNELKESSREALPKAKGYSRDHVRFVVADEFEGKVDGYQMNLRDTSNIETNLKVAVPRAINRYRKQGNVGVQFVHGGASLQELLIPVIKFYKHKKEIHQLVTFKRIDQTDKITSGSLKVTLIQDQPVSNEYKSSELIFGIYADSGELLTNEAELHLNSTSSNPKERLFEVILSLNSQGSKANFGYLKAFEKKDKTRLNSLGLNDLIKISSLMEKDEF
ncbi:BREX-1 system phosphatase PglZ type A [Sphingobacterium multivorum]|uniref:BREX-1 system phosphatase PglZ type A n=1 Tax=Sphingobacterium multivorum TaxID=28454 RepID=UPI002FD8EAE7